MATVTDYDKQKVLEHIMSKLDLSYVTRFTDETVIDASDLVAKRFVTIELVVPEPKSKPVQEAYNYGGSIKGPPTTTVVWKQ